MSNPWINAACAVIVVEGVAEMAANAILIFYLARTKYSPAARLYYTACIISAILSFYTSLGILVTVDLPTLVDGNIVAVFYGPLLGYFPKWFNDLICVAFFSQLHTMYQMIPSPAVLQWLSLTKSDYGSIKKMALAYAVPLACNMLSWKMMFGFVPSDDLRNRMTHSVDRLFGINNSQYQVFGLPVMEKIRSNLLSVGASISRRTKQMQRRFFLTQIAQVFLPFVLMAFPLGLMFGAAFLSWELHNLIFLVELMFYPTPMCTALLLITFVRKTSKNRTPVNTRVSMTKSSISPFSQYKSDAIPKYQDQISYSS